MSRTSSAHPSSASPQCSTPRRRCATAQVGNRTEDAIACARWVAYYETKKPRKVHVVGVGQAGVPALHAAALAPKLISSVQLRRTLSSWSEIVGKTTPRRALSSTVHGALGIYDLPDLVRLLGDQAVVDQNQ